MVGCHDFKLLNTPQWLERLLAFQREFARVLGQESMDNSIVLKDIFLGSVRCDRRFLQGGRLVFGLRRLHFFDWELPEAEFLSGKEFGFAASARRMSGELCTRLLARIASTTSREPLAAISARVLGLMLGFSSKAGSRGGRRFSGAMR